MTYQEIKDRLTKCELTLEKIKDGSYTGKDITEKTQKLELLKESLQNQLIEAEKGMVATDDENKAKELADKGVNVKLTSEMKPGSEEAGEHERMKRLSAKDQETINKIRALMQSQIDHDEETYNREIGEDAEEDAKNDVDYKAGWHDDPRKDEGDVDAAEDGGDLDVGHQDDEPDMLKQYAYDIATYAAKLYKQLDKYDKMDGEVDFPNWWQSKVILAKDYISKAQHYLEFEEKQPAIDALALEGKVNERLRFLSPEKQKANDAKFEKRMASLKALEKGIELHKAGKISDEELHNLKLKAGTISAEGKDMGVSKKKETKFHKELDTLVHDTFGKREDEMNEGQAQIKKKLDKINHALQQHKDKTIAISKIPADQRSEEDKAHLAKMVDLTKMKKQLTAQYDNAVGGIGTGQELSDVDEALPTGFGTGQGRSKTISKGRESRPDIKAAQAAAVKTPKKYVMKNGIPHKYDADGNLVPLKKMEERVGGIDEFISLIQDRAADSDFTEEEEAVEVIEAIADHYGIDIEFGRLGDTLQETNEEKGSK